MAGLALLSALLAPPAMAGLLGETRLVNSNGAFVDWFAGGVGIVASADVKGVAIDGDVLVVGAMLDDVGGNTEQGSATVFRRDDDRQDREHAHDLDRRTRRNQGPAPARRAAEMASIRATLEHRG